jgi:hypothetical protein
MISEAVVGRKLETTASEIISVTLLPIIWHPSHSPYFESKITFTNPSEFPDDWAFPLAVKGNFPTLMSNPFSIACFSVNPTDAISGLQ